MQPPAATASHYGKIGILPKAVPKRVPLFGAQKKAETVTGYHDLGTPAVARLGLWLAVAKSGSAFWALRRPTKSAPMTQACSPARTVIP